MYNLQAISSYFSFLLNCTFAKEDLANLPLSTVPIFNLLLEDLPIKFSIVTSSFKAKSIAAK